jgi:hypothetical protein
MRKKRGGSVFSDRFKAGFKTVQYGLEEGISTTQRGYSNAKIGFDEAKKNYDAEINRAAVGGEKDAVLGWDYDKFEDEEFKKYTSPFARINNSKVHEFSRNSYSKPNRKPILPSKPKENYKSIKEITLGGGRKRKTRRRKKRGGDDPTIGEKVFVKWPHDDGSYKYYTGKFMGRYNNAKWYKWAEWDASTHKYKKTQGINFEIYPFVKILPEEVEAAQGLTELIDSNNQNVEDLPSGGGRRKRKTRRRRRKRKTRKKKRKKSRKTRRRRR